MLVGTLQVKIGRATQIVAPLQHAGVSAARIKPDIEDIRLLHKIGAAAIGTGGIIRKECRDIVRKPDIRASGFHLLSNGFNHRRRCHLMRATGAANDRDRHAPVALARDAPVRALLDHGADTILPPFRRPCCFFNLFQRLIA